MQAHFTGGEPLLRDDLEALVAAARALDLYTNLVTSGVGLTPERAIRLREVGLDHVQLSLQDDRESNAARITGRECQDRKLRAAQSIKAAGLPFTLNVVLHRDNIGRIPEIVALAESAGAERLELANAQYLGWALKNREALLPSYDQIEQARIDASVARERLRGRVDISFVIPDYFTGYPKACMDGWAARFVVVSPGGLVLPCQAAHTIPELTFANARTASLTEAWHSAPGMNAFRGDAWMPEPCKSCDLRAVDFGGCRCQAYHLTGRADVADPACKRSPHHGAVAAATARIVDAPIQLRSKGARRRQAETPWTTGR